MRKFKFLFLAIIAVAFVACSSEDKGELVGRWNAEKIVVGGVEYTEVEFVYFQFNANGTCIFNIEGFEGDDVTANYSYSDNKIVLSSGGDSIVILVKKKTDTELVLEFPPFEESEEVGFTIHYRKA